MRNASLLIFLGQRHDHARQRRREQQRAAGFRRGLEDEFHVLAKAEVEHLVGLVEHDGFQLEMSRRFLRKMIAEPAGRADHDVAPAASSRCSRRGSMPPTQETTRASAWR
jgi:hypothetical protein